MLSNTPSALCPVNKTPSPPRPTTPLQAGPILAASDRFQITIQGRGGHAAAPHLALDPVVAASTAVVALQQIVSRGSDSLEGGVVTVATFNTGAC